MAEQGTDGKVVTTISIMISDNGDMGIECRGEPIGKAMAVGVLEMAKGLFLNPPAATEEGEASRIVLPGSVPRLVS